MKVNRHKCYICPLCLDLYLSERRYKSHLSLCRNDGTLYTIPEGSDSLLSFTTFKNIVPTPFVIYSDLQTCTEEEEVVKRGKVVSRHHHVPISVAPLTVCRDQPEFGSKPFIYTGRNCIDVLLYYLDHKVNHLREIYENVYEPCRRRETSSLVQPQLCNVWLFFWGGCVESERSLSYFWSLPFCLVFTVQLN